MTPPTSATTTVQTIDSQFDAYEHDRSLDAPDQLRRRGEALEWLDTCFPNIDEGHNAPATAADVDRHRRAAALVTRLQAIDDALFRSLRDAILDGAGVEALLPWARNSRLAGRAAEVPDDEGYDHLDTLVSGILQFDAPAEAAVLPDGMVFYQPTPARHVFDLIERSALTSRDVFVDLGSGLGHVSMLVAICTRARCVGIELEPAYVDCARRSAQALRLANVAFVCRDARMADLSDGTLFYLYTPFTGTILRAVLDALRHEATPRAIRVCTYGPCTATVREEAWLEALGPVTAQRIAVFRSR